MYFGIYFAWPLGSIQAGNATAPPRLRLPSSAVGLCASNALDHESLHLVFQTPDLVHEIAGFVRGDARCNHGSADTASTAQSCLARNVYIWNVLWHKLVLNLERVDIRREPDLVFAEKREMQEDGERGSISC